MERNRILPRAVAVLLPLSVLVGCTQTTTEGITTNTCVDSESTFQLSVGEKIYLGDLSSSESFGSGTHNDWFELSNESGAIHYDAEKDSALADGNGDEGKVTQAEGGFNYAENGATYHVRYENPPNSIDAEIAVSVTMICE